MKTLLWIQDRLVIGSLVLMVLLGVLWISGGLLTAIGWLELAGIIKPLFDQVYRFLVIACGLVIAISLAGYVVDLVNMRESSTGRY
jgi:hypothetical protein